MSVWGVVEGPHRGDFFGVPPTGRKLYFDAPDLHRIAGGKIAEEWASDDGLAILAGLGVYTPPGATWPPRRGPFDMGVRCLTGPSPRED